MKKRKKIVIISHFGYPLYNKKCKSVFGGGAAVQLYILSMQLSKIGNFNTYVISGAYTNNKIELYNGIRIYNVLPLKRTALNYLKGLFNFFFFLLKINPDVIIQRCASVTTGLCALYCNIFKKKFIFSIANRNDVNGVAENNGMLGKVYKYGLNNATYIIAQNKNQINELQNHRKKKFFNIKVIKNSYKIEKPVLSGKKFILWVGRGVRWKKPELFLKLATEFPKQRFVIICYKEKDEDYWDKIFKYSSRISNLKFIEFVPFSKIEVFFKESKVFVCTSTDNEGFPNTFIQAFKNKTPVISLNTNPDNFLVKNKIGFFCENNFNKMKEFLQLLLNNYELYQNYSENAFSYVRKNHDIDKNIIHWFRLIRDL